jgi:hypothetical protein
MLSPALMTDIFISHKPWWKKSSLKECGSWARLPGIDILGQKQP